MADTNIANFGRMEIRKNNLLQMYQTLRNRFGFLNWWPGDTPLEIALGAILTQSTSWKNVEKAIANLKKENLLSVEALLNVESADLAELIRPSLYYNQKAKKVKGFISYLVHKYDSDLEKMKAVTTEVLRLELLSLWGIGPETADSIILYALNKPIFVIDAYTRRILSRHGISAAADEPYDTLQQFFQANIPRDVELYKDFHAQIVEVGKNYCRRRPLCSECPLKNKKVLT